MSELGSAEGDPDLYTFDATSGYGLRHLLDSSGFPRVQCRSCMGCMWPYGTQFANLEPEVLKHFWKSSVHTGHAHLSLGKESVESFENTQKY